MPSKNAYAVLGVTQTASSKEIRTVYRQLVPQCHPDFHPNDPASERRFKEIEAAYCLLTDPEKRAALDRRLALPANDAEFFQLNEAGALSLEQQLPSAPAACIRGEHGCFLVEVPPRLLAKGGRHRVSLPLVGRTDQASIELVVEPGGNEPRYYRVADLGWPGRNGGRHGDLFVVLLPKRTRKGGEP